MQTTNFRIKSGHHWWMSRLLPALTIILLALATMIALPVYAQDQDTETETPITEAMAAADSEHWLHDDRVEDQRFVALEDKAELLLIMLETPHLSPDLQSFCSTRCKYTFSISNGMLVLEGITRTSNDADSYYISESAKTRMCRIYANEESWGLFIDVLRDNMRACPVFLIE